MVHKWVIIEHSISVSIVLNCTNCVVNNLRNGKIHLFAGSKILFVGRAQKKAERAERLKRELEDKYYSQIQNLKASNLYVKNLNASVDDKKLQEFFGGFGHIISSRVMRHNNGTSKRFGFVSFSTPEEAKNALDTLNGKHNLTISSFCHFIFSGLIDPIVIYM